MSTPAQPLTWTKGSDYHIKSECGGYTVARTGRDQYTRYSAWRVTENKWRSIPLGVFLEPGPAKAACQAHADQGDQA